MSCEAARNTTTTMKNKKSSLVGLAQWSNRFFLFLVCLFFFLIPKWPSTCFSRPPSSARYAKISFPGNVMGRNEKLSHIYKNKNKHKSTSRKENPAGLIGKAALIRLATYKSIQEVKVLNLIQHCDMYLTVLYSLLLKYDRVI